MLGVLAIVTIVVGIWSLTRSRQAADPTLVHISAPKLEDLHTVFKSSPQGVELSPKQAFGARELCPSFTDARYKAGKNGMGLVTVYGEHLSRVAAVTALKDGAPIAEAIPHLAPEGDSLSFAVACDDCTLILALRLDGLQVGCVGPGYSLALEKGALRSGSPPETP